jgi:hypothetical protein
MRAVCLRYDLLSDFLCAVFDDIPRPAIMPCWERLFNGDFDVEVNYFSTFSFLFGDRVA